jgi:hypothetical protein
MYKPASSAQAKEKSDEKARLRLLAQAVAKRKKAAGKNGADSTGSGQVPGVLRLFRQLSRK